MLRIIRQFFGARQTPSNPDETLDTTLVYVRVKPDTKPVEEPQVEEIRLDLPPAVAAVPPAPVSAQPANRQPKPARTTLRKSGASTPLASLGIFSARQITLLRRIGCRTDHDLLRLTPQRLEKRLADFISAQQHSLNAPLTPPIDRIRSVVRRGRWAIQFAKHFDDMTPRESLLLRAVHRGSRQTLAQDRAGMIRRDLQRLALSSRGQRMVTLDQIPELQRVKNWIATARDGRKSTSKDLVNLVALSVVSPSEDSQTDVPMMSR